jgi:hypothetical protein
MQSVDAPSSMSERFVTDGHLRPSGRNDASLSRLCHGQTASCQPASSLSSALLGVPLAEPLRERRRSAAMSLRDRPVAPVRYDARERTDVIRRSACQPARLRPIPENRDDVLRATACGLTKLVRKRWSVP